jgi:cytochrome c oxidase subunit II
MRVEVIGHQWWFEFHYPDHDIDTANELVIPRVGRPVWR